MKTLEVIKEQIKEYEEELKELRERFDRYDSNHPWRQVHVAQDIATLATRIDTLMALCEKLGGK